MSSLLAHAAAGATAFVCRPNASRTPQRRAAWALACVSLAVLPDLDYLLWWWWRIQLEPRVSHSLGVAALSAGVAWLGLGGWRQPAAKAAAATLLAAAASHEALDYLVGVHPAPWLWPWVAERFIAPAGWLPSAGALQWRNPLLYRNLLLEAVVLGPVVLALCGWRRPAWRVRPWVWALIVPAWAAALAVSAQLPRPA